MRLLLLLAFTIADAASAVTFTTHLTAPPAPDALLVSATNDSIVYETFRHTLYRSVDGGATFTARGAVLDYVAIDPVDPDLLYDTAQGTVRRSIDGGITWTSIRNNLPSLTPTSRALVVSPRRTLFLGSTCISDHMGGGVFRSADFGNTWSGDASSGLCVAGISVDPIDESVWTLLEYWTFNLPYIYRASIVASERAPDVRFGILYSINSNPPKAAQVMRTTDGWRSWQPLTVDGTPYRLDIERDSRRVFLGTSTGLYRSDDAGASWMRVSAAPAGAIGSTKIAGASLFVGTVEQIYRAPLATLERFTPLGPLPAEVPRTVYSLAVDPKTGALYAAGRGVWRSSDAGQHWETISTTADARAQLTVDGIGDVYALGYPPASPNLVLWHYAAASGAWETLTTSLASAKVQLLVADPARHGVLYATGLGGLYASLDGGHSWRRVVDVGDEVLTVAVDPNRAGVVYAAGSRGVFVSIDGGGTWRLLDAAATTKIAVAPSRSSTLYRLRSAGSSILERSDDGGATWQQRLVTSTGLLLVDPLNENSLWSYSAAEVRVVHSDDGGKTWSPTTLDPFRPRQAYIEEWIVSLDGTHMHAVILDLDVVARGEWDAVIRAERRRAARR